MQVLNVTTDILWPVSTVWIDSPITKRGVWDLRSSHLHTYTLSGVW
nr:MAG TPA: hypothetical protein [Caudoviricetes sp.]